VKIELRYFGDCPNWRTTMSLVNEALDELGMDAEVTTRLVETEEDAVALDFRGSPTLIVDGVDPFAEPEAPIGLACRIYRTEEGMAGSPTPDQIEAALAESA
jgi:hypothetical protein